MTDLGTRLERAMQRIPPSTHTIFDVARRRDRRRRNQRLGAALVVLLIVALVAFGFVRTLGHERRTPATPHSEGTIVFTRQLRGSEVDTISTIRPDGTGELQLVTADSFAVSPDGTRIMYSAFTDDPVRWVTFGAVGLDGSGRTVLSIPDPAMALWPMAWSPDGERFLASGFGPDPSSNGIYTARTSDGGDLLRVTVAVPPGRDRPIAYSPDGSRILFLRTQKPVAGEEAAENLFVVDVDGSGLRQLNPAETSVTLITPGTSSPAASPPTPATWSPDGRSVAFVASGGTPGQIRDGTAEQALFVVGLDGAPGRRITPWGEVSGSAWSPDGAWIAFSMADPDLRDVFVVHPDGTGLKPVTSSADGLGSFEAVWSPDGARLLFGRSADGDQFNFDLWIIYLDGSGAEPLTHTPAEYSAYGWASADVGA